MTTTLTDRILQLAADVLVGALFWVLGRADSVVCSFANGTDDEAAR